MSDRILVQHPDSTKRGTNIDRAKYDIMRHFILDTLRAHPNLSFADLRRLADDTLTDFDGSVGWYLTTVKLDLEARGEVERSKGSPQRLRLVGE